MKSIRAVRLLLVIAFIGSAVLLTSREAAARSAAATLPTLRWYGLVGTGTWVRTLDPAFAADANSIYTMYMVDANLVKILPNGQVAPDLATWKVSPNHRVYTFTLRKSARFSNGDPVTAQDVLFSLTRSLKKSTNSPVAPLYLGHILGAKALLNGKTSKLAGVKVLGSQQVQITTDKPVAFFLGALSYESGDVLDPRVVTGKPVLTYLTNTCSANVGAGPFMFSCRNRSSNKSSFFPAGATPSMTLVPNPYYYGRKPHVRVVMQAIATTETNYRDFQANGIDVTYVPTGEIAANRHKPGFLEYPTSSVDYLTPNLYQPPFNNLHCRLAVAYAINRDAIGRDVLHGSEVPIYDVVPKGMLGYYNGANNPHYDPAMAKKELAACPGGLHNVRVVYGNTSTDLSNEYAALQSMWQSVGITTKLDAMTGNDWVSQSEQPMSKTHIPLIENFWYQDYPDPQDYCTLLLHSGSNWNIGGFDNRTYDRLVDQADTTFNRAKRAQLYMEAQHIAISQGAWITVGQQLGFSMVKPWVHGFVGTEPYVTLMPRNNDWANVSVSPH